MPPRRHNLALSAALAAYVGGVGMAAAVQLDKEACDALRSEEAGLVTAGIKTDMDKGPEWAKTNLTPERLQQVARFIELEEQLSFRCRVLANPVKQKRKGAPGKADAKSAAVHVAPDDPEGQTETNAEKAAPAAPEATPATAATKPVVLTPKPTVAEPESAKPVAKPAVLAPKPAAKPAARPPSSATARIRKSPSQSPGLFIIE